MIYPTFKAEPGCKARIRRSLDDPRLTVLIWTVTWAVMVITAAALIVYRTQTPNQGATMALSPHDERVKDAEDAIDRVATDTSVDQEQTLESLSELVDRTQESIDAIKEDLGR